jgi:fibro-slime domain-containing protein
MNRTITTTAILALGLAQLRCSSTSNTSPGGDSGMGGSGSGAAGNPGNDSGSGFSDSPTGSFFDDAGGQLSGAPVGAGTGTITAIVRDFRFYDHNDPTTDPDFENVVADDRGIVAMSLGADGKPVYAHPGGTTVTTHGQAAFDNWYHDVAGTNYHVEVPLPITRSATGSYLYDSQVSGVPYNDVVDTGNGFFPIDDGTNYATPFGNQGKVHNYSFTVEIHTVFPYRGGEFFRFRGDDDVFVFVNGQLVIDLGGVHVPEMGQINLDSLGLTIGNVYPLDFFFAERHTTQSNVLFETTLQLQAIQ